MKQLGKSDDNGWGVDFCGRNHGFRIELKLVQQCHGKWAWNNILNEHDSWMWRNEEDLANLGRIGVVVDRSAMIKLFGTNNYGNPSHHITSHHSIEPIPSHPIPSLSTDSGVAHRDRSISLPGAACLSHPLSVLVARLASYGFRWLALHLWRLW